MTVTLLFVKQINWLATNLITLATASIFPTCQEKKKNPSKNKPKKKKKKERVYAGTQSSIKATSEWSVANVHVKLLY